MIYFCVSPRIKYIDQTASLNWAFRSQISLLYRILHRRLFAYRLIIMMFTIFKPKIIPETITFNHGFKPAYQLPYIWRHRCLTVITYVYLKCYSVSKEKYLSLNITLYPFDLNIRQCYVSRPVSVVAELRSIRLYKSYYRMALIPYRGYTNGPQNRIWPGVKRLFSSIVYCYY